jgi:small GTP-binding protein
MTVNLKFIIIGSAGVGKTAILKRLVTNSYSEDLHSTVGVQFNAIKMMIDDRQVKLQIWDTAGQERFRSISKQYYRNVVGVILVFDITDRTSFDELSSWIGDVHTLCEANVVVQLIGNKADLKSHRAVTIGEAEAFASLQRVQYIETSAKIGENVTEAFVRLATRIISRGIRTAMPPIDRSPLVEEFGGVAKKETKCC